MMLKYKLRDSKAEKTVKVSFDPQLSSYDEVKPRLLSMKLDAEESLGMTPRPQLKSFRLPVTLILRTALPILALVYTTFGGEQISWLRNAVGGQRTLWWIWAFLIATHALESVYTAHLCRKHRTGLFHGLLYVVGTLLFGFPIWTDMRRRIQKLRIESIEKVH